MAAIKDYTKLPGFERKSFPSFVKAVDEDQGIVTQIVAVMGNRDAGNDIIMPGAFAKSLQERGTRIKVLDQHGTDSVTRVVGKPLSIREIGRDQLPPEVIKAAPTATGGLETVTQYALDTQRGKDVFNLIKGEYLNEASIGYDTIVAENTKEKAEDGEEYTARRLKEVRLWEYSPVIWGMNDATSVVAVKQKPAEAKPYDVFEVEDEYCVFLVDEDGNRTGETFGCHETQEEAREQIAAIEAAEEEAAMDPVEEQKEEDKEGRVLSAANRSLLQSAQAELQEALDAIASLLAASEVASEDGSEETKAVNLSGHVSEVRHAFNERHDYDWYVTEVWDSYVIVSGGVGEYPYYRVAYWMGDGTIEFADMQDWVGGAYLFSPGAHGLQLMALEVETGPEVSLTAEAAEPTISPNVLRAKAMGLLLEIESEV